MLLRGEHEDDNTCMMFYGTDNGILGQLFLGRSGGYPGWTLTNVRKLGGITSIGDIMHRPPASSVVPTCTRCV